VAHDNIENVSYSVIVHWPAPPKALHSRKESDLLAWESAMRGIVVCMVDLESDPNTEGRYYALTSYGKITLAIVGLVIDCIIILALLCIGALILWLLSDGLCKRGTETPPEPSSGLSSESV
jgi:hypothetical protein